MKQEDLENITNSIREKLGEENSAMISDDLGSLITMNNMAITEKQQLNSRIETLEKKNDNLVQANSHLLQQIPMGIEKSNKSNEEEKVVKSFNFMDAFDDKGNFKKKI